MITKKTSGTSGSATTTGRAIRQPIIILGCARSATTMMGRIISHHPDVAYWVEPRPIWMYGNAYRNHYELSAADLKPRIARYIDRRFSQFLEASGKSRFAEKTPSNCFRIPFVYALYPDCRMINIIRDGRDVVKSILQIEKRPTGDNRLFTRLKETSPLEWPAYIPMFFRTFWRTRVLRKKTKYWGPKPRGWQAWTELPRHLMVAEQWRATVEATLRDGRTLPEENYLEIRYESLMREPVQTVRRILAFAGLSEADEVIAYTASHIDPNRASQWKGTLTDEQEKEIEDRLKPMLTQLGYLDESATAEEAGRAGVAGGAPRHG